MKCHSEPRQPTPQEEVLCYLLSLLDTVDQYGRPYFNGLIFRFKLENEKHLSLKV